MKQPPILAHPLQLNIVHDGSRRHFVLGVSSAMVLFTLPFMKSVLAAAISKQLTTLNGKFSILALIIK